MSLHRKTRPRKPKDYAKLNTVGTTGEPLEEGQIADSPFRLNPSDDEFQFQQEEQSATSNINSRFEDNQDTDLDYEDDLLSTRLDVESVITVKTSEHDHDHMQGGQGGLEQNEQQPMFDLGRDEVWQQQEQVMAANRERCERLRKRLERQKQVAEEKLREEQEGMELAKMENEIKQINQKRLVVVREHQVNRGFENDTRVKTVKGRVKTNNRQSKQAVNAVKVNTMPDPELHNTAAGEPEPAGVSTIKGTLDHDKHAYRLPTQLLVEYDRINKWLAESVETTEGEGPGN